MSAAHWKPSTKDMLIMTDREVSFEFYTPIQGEGNLEFHNSEYHWERIDSLKENANCKEISRELNIKLGKYNFLFEYKGYSVLYADSETRTVLVVRRDNEILSAYQEPGCMLQLGDELTEATGCTTSDYHFIRIINYGDVESTIVIKIRRC